MEDMQTIIWIILIVMAIFGSATKKRNKRRQTGAETAEAGEAEWPHREVWPRGESATDRERSASADAEPPRKQPERPADWPVGRPEAQRMRDIRGTIDVRGAAEAPFPEEAQSLEEIPAEAYDRPEHADRPGTAGHTGRAGRTAPTPGFERIVRNLAAQRPSTSSATAPGSNRPPAERPANDAPKHMPAASKAEAAPEAPVDFDLRRAIIYSEILKPKFDE